MFLPDCLPDSSLASAHLTKKSWAPANSAALTLPWHSEEGLEFQPTEQLVQSIFTMLCSIERNIKLKYIHRDCHLFLPFHKEKSFHSCSHCQSYFFPIHLKLPALSTTLCLVSPGFSCNLSLPTQVLNLYSFHLFKTSPLPKG